MDKISQIEVGNTTYDVKAKSFSGMLPVANGGTGASTAAGACTSLGIVDLIYPVGSIYMSVNSTSPATLFGGTWERIQDRFLLAAGSSYSAGGTGGSADATLPSHTHTFTGSSVTSGTQSANHTHSGTVDNNGSHRHYLIHNYESQSGFTNPNQTIAMSFQVSDGRSVNYILTSNGYDANYGLSNSSGSHQHSFTTGSNSANHTHSVTAAGTNSTVGSSATGANMPPYFVVYIWKRTD